MFGSHYGTYSGELLEPLLDVSASFREFLLSSDVAGLHDGYFYNKIAENPSSWHEKEDVHWLLASSPSTPDDVLHDIALYGSPYNKDILARRYSLPEKIKIELALDSPLLCAALSWEKAKLSPFLSEVLLLRCAEFTCHPVEGYTQESLSLNSAKICRNVAAAETLNNRSIELLRQLIQPDDFAFLASKSYFTEQHYDYLDLNKAQEHHQITDIFDPQYGLQDPGTIPYSFLDKVLAVIGKRPRQEYVKIVAAMLLNIDTAQAKKDLIDTGSWKLLWQDLQKNSNPLRANQLVSGLLDNAHRSDVEINNFWVARDIPVFVDAVNFYKHQYKSRLNVLC